MRVSITIESEGVTTEVARDYEPTLVPYGVAGKVRETPTLQEAADHVANAAVVAHRLQIITD